MIVLLYLIILLCCLISGVFCAVQAFLMCSDAFSYRRGRSMAALGGSVMAVGSAVCFVVFAWMLNHSPLD